MSRKNPFLAVLALLGLASTASAEGINLSWDDCGAAGVDFKTFSCTTNTGGDDLIFSFDPPPGLANIIGILVRFDVRTESTNLVDWWDIATPGGTAFACRDTLGISVTTDFTSGPFSCVPFFPPPSPTVVTGWYTTPKPLNGIAFGVNLGTAIENFTGWPANAGTEYYAYKVTLKHYKSTGPDSCAGCSTPACIVFNQATIHNLPCYDVDCSQRYEVIMPLDRTHVTWQAENIATCPASTEVRKNRTWGAIRSMYR